MQLRHRILLAAGLGLVMIGCDQPSFINADNRTDATYMAYVGDEGFVVPPKRRVTLVVFGWPDPKMPGPVQVMDASCMPIHAPFPASWGTIVIDGSGTAVFNADHPGSADKAQASTFCAPNGSGGSLSPAPARSS